MIYFVKEFEICRGCQCFTILKTSGVELTSEISSAADPEAALCRDPLRPFFRRRLAASFCNIYNTYLIYGSNCIEIPQNRGNVKATLVKSVFTHFSLAFQFILLDT